ncbi:MAG TPA: hypothetical protein VFN11_15340, partial [Ktedonobacterales bacterium]|nr:hypothetical protein [Ktedonobacterales bacterium]
SYSRWQSLGRHILKGSRAKDVIVPVLIKEPAPDEEPAEDETLEERRERVARLIGFKVVRAVFALSDTEGADLPPAPVPGWDLQKALDKLGIKEVPFESTDGNLQGWSHGLEYALNPISVHPNKTRFHELGHIVLGHTMPHRHGEYVLHRGLMEFEAEGTAYLVMNELGLLDDETASHSRGYIQHWIQDERPPETSIRRVFRAAEAILKTGRVDASFDANPGDLSRQ